MTDPVKTALITGLLYAVPTVVVGILNRKHVSGKIEEVRLQINGRLEQLLKSEKGASHAEGMAEQKEISEREKLKGPPYL